jgi:hypothetical protein
MKEDGTWRPIFFEEIDRVAAAARLEPLRDKHFGDGTTEIRVWEGFGHSPLKGYVLYRGKASKGWIVEDRVSLRPVTPKSGWEAFWKALESSKIYSLPDSETLPGGVAVTDGTSYVVEIHTGKTYRNYFYSNPRHQPWPEAKSMLAVVSLLREQLGQ